MEADGTLILNVGEIYGGTLVTAEVCRRDSKPYLAEPLALDEFDIIARARCHGPH